MTGAGATDRRAPGTGLLRAGRALGASGMAVVIAALVCFVTRAFPAGSAVAVRLLTLAGLLFACALVFGAALRGSRLAGVPAGGALPVAAGALAGAYFTLHAAHAVPSLRVIDSPLVAGALLAAAAAAGCLAARRYRARPLAGLAALLALVAVLVPPAPASALVAAAVLVAAAFTLAVPDAWRTVPQAMLLLAYAGYAAQRVLRDGWVVMPYPSREDALTAGALLALFAVAFAWPVWRSDAPAFRERERAAFLCLDLALAWPLTSLVLRHGAPRDLAAVLGVSAALLFGLAMLLRRHHPAFPLLQLASVAPGVVALTTAVAAWRFPLTAPMPLLAALSGMALAMAAEYVESALLRGLTLLTALAAAALAATTADPRAAFLAAGVLAYTAFFVDRHREGSNPGSAFFAVASAAVALAATLAHATPARQPLTLALVGLVLIALGHFGCARPLAAAGQIPIVAAYVLFLRRTAAVDLLPVTLAALVVAGLLSNAWWRSLVAGRSLRAARRGATALHAVATAAAVLMALRVWIAPEAAAAWLAVPALLALTAAAYAAFTRDHPTGSAWQALLLFAVAQFALRGGEARRLVAAGGLPPSTALSLALLAPIAALLVLAAIADGRLLGRATSGPWASGASALARGLAAGLLVVWCSWFVAPALQFVLVEALAVAWLVHAARRDEATGVALSTLLSGGAVWLFWRATSATTAIRWLDLVGFGLLLLQQQLWRHRYARLVPAALHTPAMILGIGSLWRFAHVTTAALAGDAWTPLAWAAVGAVACALGLARREPAYRLLGLAILAAALARVAGLGPALPTGTRVLSAAAIGLLTVGLGFAYERLSARGTQEAHP